MSFDYKKLAWFVAGTVFGSVGIKLLCTDDAKKVYTHVTAAGLRAKDCVMETVTTAQENWGDILADAKELNAQREAAAAEEFVEATEEDFEN